MRIAVNTRLLIPHKLDGMGWFCYETMKRITRDHPEHEFIFIFDRAFSKEYIFTENIKPKIVRPATRHPILWYLWLEWSLPRKLRKWKVDVFVSPDGFISLRSNIPAIPVIHDINFKHRPEDLPFFSRWYYNYFFPKFARKAIQIGTVSEYSANDICQSYNIEKSKVSVFYNGVNEAYRPVDQLIIDTTRKKYANGKPYFIFVGTLHPRKNIVNMLKAFDLFKETDMDGIKFIIVGEKMFLTREIDDCLSGMKHSKDVIFTGRLDPEYLYKVVASAIAMCFVPFFEGFGIPMIEAMKCRVPVIASNVTSLPEVGRDAVLYCDPFSSLSISEAMIKITSDNQLREELMEKGSTRVREFTWEKSAEGFWNLIEKVLNES